MASNQDNNDFPKSMKNLWTLLSGTLNLKSQQFIGTQLSEYGSQLLSGLVYFRKHDPNNDSIDVLTRKHQIDYIAIDLLHKMSVFLDLNAIQCNDLFRSYLIYEFKGTPESVKSLFTNEKNIKQLFHQLWHFYYSERIFTLFNIKQILSHWKHTSDHVYHQIFHDFLEAINGENKLISNLLQQLSDLNSCKAPSRLSNGPYFDEQLANKWLVNTLREQTELLQILLLYFKEFEPSVENIIYILNIFKSNNFGSKFSNLSVNDDENIDENLIKFIGFLESMLIVDCFDLNWLYKCQLQDMEHHLIKEEKISQLKQLDGMIRSLTTTYVEHSPILLSWMIIRSCQFDVFDFDSDSSSQIVSQLGANALKLNIFAYLEKSLDLPQMIAIEETIASNLIYSTIGSLLSVTFNIYNIEMLAYSTASLNNLCAKLFNNNDISKDLFDNGLDSGLGIIIRSSLDNFPYQTNAILRFCCSLSDTVNCRVIFEKLSILSNLTTYTEEFDASFTHIVPTQQDSVFMLLNDRNLYRNYELSLKKGTKGVLRTINANKVIEWRNINIDGWKVLFHRSKETYDLISKGQFYSVSEDSLNELSRIVLLCSHLINHKCFAHISSFNNLISLFFELFELFSTNNRSPRMFMANVLSLCAAIIKQDIKSSVWVWQRITEKKFIPYMIGLTNDWQHIVSGKDTNSSILGKIIASDECIRGYYQLCISFLNLVMEISKKNELRNDECFLASFIYIIQELFPSHYFWNYIDNNDCIKIGRLCYEIFYYVLAKISKKSEFNKLEKVCICSLMEGNAAEVLLKTIKNGESIVKDVIINSGNDTALMNNDEIVSVRYSLSILNFLMVLHTNPKSPTTVVEKALFSSQSKPSILLILAHYVFQRYDTHLATLAVDLLKELAKKFPMSMLACLGSDAEAIRDHFLYRLEEVTEDLNLKIALLNFLSQCVRYQPGLMEMFLNVSNVKDDCNQSTTGCLQTVLEILAEKREGKYFCPFELHFAALKFVYTFWLQPHLLAIDSLKKTSNVWTLITFPLFEPTISNNKLCALVLRILAREIFYVKTLERDKFDCDLENKFKDLREGDHLTKLSSYICSSFMANSTSDEENMLLLLDAWKDFLVSISKFDPFNILEETKAIIANDILCGLLYQLKNTQNETAINLLSDIMLIVLSNWKKTCIKHEKDCNTYITELFLRLTEIKESLPLSVIIAIETIAIQFLQLYPKSRSIEWFSPICDLLIYGFRVIEKQIIQTEKSLLIDFKLMTTSIAILTLLVDYNSSNYSYWIPKLRSFLLLESVSHLLIYLIDHKIGVELANYIMCLLITLSSIKEASHTLLIIGFFDNLCVSMQNTYSFKSNEKINIDHSANSWIKVFEMCVRLVIKMLETLKHHFIDKAITFIAVHLEHMQNVLTKSRTCPKLIDIQESISIVSLCHSLSYYKQIWQTTHNISFELFRTEILKTGNSVIAFLIRPNLLAYILENPQISVTALISSELTPKKITQSQSNIKEQGLHKSISWESDFLTQNIEHDVHNALLILQMVINAYLQKVTPDILVLLEKQGMNSCDVNLLLNTNFASPNINPDNILSFGALLNVILMCIKTINRNEKITFTTTTVTEHSLLSTDVLNYIFETSFALLVSQNLMAQLSPSINSVDKQIIAREIKSELSSILSNIGSRQSKRISQTAPSIVLTPKSPTIAIIEKSYVKFLLQFIDKLSQ